MLSSEQHELTPVLSGRTARVRGLVSRVERLRVYNLHVAELHTYAVGQGSVLVHNRGVPTEGRGGTWIDPTTGVTTRNENSGVWRSTRPAVLAVESPPGGPALTEVVVVYTNGNPDFSPYVRSIDGFNKGEVQIILSEAPAKTTRLRHDMAAADGTYANLLNSQGSRRPDGQLWTARDITIYREANDLTWHHMEDVNPDTGQCTMQLVSWELNDKCYHDGGRVIRDRQLGLR